MAKLSEIEGIGEAYANRLQDAGITTLENLFRKGRC